MRKNIFLMAAELGDTDTYYCLAMCYYQKKDYDNMFKYFLMDTKNGNEESKLLLGKILFLNPTIINKFMPLVFEIQKENTKLTSELKSALGSNEILKEENTHLKYMPSGPGYLDTKQHFDIVSKKS